MVGLVLLEIINKSSCQCINSQYNFFDRIYLIYPFFSEKNISELSSINQTCIKTRKIGFESSSFNVYFWAILIFNYYFVTFRLQQFYYNTRRSGNFLAHFQFLTKNYLWNNLSQVLLCYSGFVLSSLFVLRLVKKNKFANHMIQ